MIPETSQNFLTRRQGAFGISLASAYLRCWLSRSCSGCREFCGRTALFIVDGLVQMRGLYLEPCRAGHCRRPLDLAPPTEAASGRLTIGHPCRIATNERGAGKSVPVTARDSTRRAVGRGEHHSAMDDPAGAWSIGIAGSRCTCLPARLGVVQIRCSSVITTVAYICRYLTLHRTPSVEVTGPPTSKAR